MRKRIIALALAVIMVLAFAAGCGGTSNGGSAGGNGGSAGGDASGGKVDASKVQLAGLVFSDDQFMNALLRGYKDAADEYGVSIALANVASDAAKEAELINTYVEQKYDGIAIAPLNKDGSIPTLKTASERGVKIAITNMNLREGADFIIGGYTSDDFENGLAIGTYAAEWISKNITGKVRLGIVHFDHSLPDQSGARWKGFLKGLDDAKVDYEIADSQANSQQDPLGLASSMIAASPDINVFFACNEGSTIGVAQAVAAEGKLGQIAVFGYDSSDQISAMILDEKTALQGVVTQDPYKMGYGAVKLLCEAILEGKDMSATTGKTEPVPGAVLTKGDLEAVKTWREDNGLKN